MARMADSFPAAGGLSGEEGGAVGPPVREQVRGREANMPGQSQTHTAQVRT